MILLNKEQSKNKLVELLNKGIVTHPALKAQGVRVCTIIENKNLIREYKKKFYPEMRRITQQRQREAGRLAGARRYSQIRIEARCKREFNELANQKLDDAIRERRESRESVINYFYHRGV